MKAPKADPSLIQKVTEFQIVGRAAPTAKNPKPPVHRMRLFGKNKVLAISRFWKFMSSLNKAKRSGGEILACNVLKEAKPDRVKNFGMWLRYDSRTGTINMYKEFRDTTRRGAVTQLLADMSGRHRARPERIQIIRICEVKNEDCRRTPITQLHNPKLKFPQIRRLPMVPKDKRMTFTTKRPNTFLK
eukprot:GHVT01056022.1.p1 GENE.GHVT01056022.1~~GHVT01056022.1.p1  ORF type:complete len:187 (-),score=36.42 GHVT01056022.1:735-1295(-)